MTARGVRRARSRLAGHRGARRALAACALAGRALAGTALAGAALLGAALLGAAPAEASVTPSSPPKIVELPLPTPHADPTIITRAGKYLWFTETKGNRIGRIDRTGSITEYALPTRDSGPYGITPGPDGNVWFIEQRANQVGVMRPDGTLVRELAIPTRDSVPYLIATGADGNVWFTEAQADSIARVTPATGVITEFHTRTPGGGPTQILAGPDGNVWFTETASGGIGRITPNGTITEFGLPGAQGSGLAPTSLVIGPDGELWYSEVGGNRVGRILVHAPNTVTGFEVPTPGGGPTGLVVGPDGNLWFGELSGNKIGRVTPDGSFLETPLRAPGSLPTSLALGPDGTIWFTETGSGLIGHVVVPAAATLTHAVGGEQSAALHHRFPRRLGATARDANGTPVAGVVVEFRAPASGAGATFAGGRTRATVVTDAHGIATAPPLTANGTRGHYRVVAAALSGDPVRFELANDENTLPTGRLLLVVVVLGAAVAIGLWRRSKSRIVGPD